MKCNIKTGSYDGRIFDNSEGSPNFGTLILIKANTGFLFWGLGKGLTGNYNFSISSSINVCDNQWHDILLTWDGTTNTNSVKMYIDNMVTPHKVTTATAIETAQASYTLRIARQASGTSFNNAYIGVLDEIEIYNDAIEYTNHKFLIQDGDRIKITNDGINLIDLGTTYNKDTFLQYGIDNLNNINSTIINKIINNEYKLLMYKVK